MTRIEVCYLWPIGLDFRDREHSYRQKVLDMNENKENPKNNDSLVIRGFNAIVVKLIKLKIVEKLFNYDLIMN